LAIYDTGKRAEIVAFAKIFGKLDGIKCIETIAHLVKL
jgi:hypothetical protein